MDEPIRVDKVKGILEGLGEGQRKEVAEELLQLWAGQVLLARPPDRPAGKPTSTYVSDTDTVRDVWYEDLHVDMYAATQSGSATNLSAKVIEELTALLGPSNEKPPQVFIGRYLPAPNSGVSAVRFYQAPGTTVALMDVLGTPPPDPILVSAASSVLGTNNLMNFVRDNAAFTELAYVHNELKDKGDVEMADQIRVAAAIALDPLGLFTELIKRNYDYVTTTGVVRGQAPLEMSSSPTRPAGGFVLQFPPTPVPSPVCVMSPTYIHTPRDPSLGQPIYMRPELLVLKVY